MKKKITRALVFALALSATGFVSSCKDYDEDVRIENNAALGEVYKKLNDEVAALKLQIQGIKQCNCDPATMQKMEQLLQGYNAGTGQSFEEYISSIINNYNVNNGTGMTAGEVQALIDAAIAKIQPGGPSITKEQIINIIEEYLSTNPQGLTRDEVKDLVNGLLADYATKQALNEAVEKLESANTAQDKKITDLTTTLTEVQGILTSLESTVTTLQGTVTGLQTVLTTIQSTLADVQSTANQALAEATAAKETANSNLTRIEALEKFVENHKDYDDEAVKQAITDIQNELKNFATKEELEAAKKEAQDLHTKALKYVDEQNKIVNDKIDGVAADLKALEKAYKDADVVLQNQINDLVADLSGVKTTVKAVQDQLNALVPRVAALEDARTKQITNIIVQQVANPAFGTVALPTDFNTNVLIAYYGEAGEESVSFPNKAYMGVDPFFFVKAKGTIVDGQTFATAGKVYTTINPTDVDFSALEGLKLVNSQDKVSPIALTNVKKSNATLHFGFTRADNGFYEADATVPVEKVSAANQIHVDKSAIASALKELVKTRSLSQAKTTVKDMAVVVAKTTNSVLNLDAQGVKASWTDAYGTHSVISEYKIAATSVKPLSFHSFDAIAEKQIGNLPGYQKAENLLNKVHNKAHELVNFGFNKFNGESTIKDIMALQIKTIDVKDLDKDLVSKFVITIDTVLLKNGISYKFEYKDKITGTINHDPVTAGGSMTGTVEIGKFDVLDEYNNVIGSVYIPTQPVSGSGTVTITDPITGVNMDVNITKDMVILDPDGDGENGVRILMTYDLSDEIEEVWGTVKDQIGSVNDMLADLQKTVDDAKDLINDINSYHATINDKIDFYMDKVTALLDKINEKGTNAVNKALRNAPKLLQPVIIINSEKGMTIGGLGGSKPSHSGSVTLVATTYSAELLAPCAAKCVTVNGQKMEIGKAGKISVPASAIKKGLNVIKYAALDYAGAEVDKTFYFIHD